MSRRTVENDGDARVERGGQSDVGAEALAVRSAIE
jgi:hypothetical protein